MKDYNRAENKILKPDAARISADKSAYSPAKSKASGASETGSSAKLDGRGSSGNKSRNHRYGGFKGTALVVLLTFSMVFASLLGAFADDLVNTVPTSEAPGGNFYSGTINTGLKEDGPYGEVPYRGYGPDYGPYNVTGVYQSQSTTSPTSFAAGLPLGTIFIDQSKIKDIYPEPVVVSKDTSIIAGLGKIGGTTRMGYDGTKPGAIKMVPGKINELKGDLFKVTFEDAAILPNGDRADLVITYSNARIVIDERYMAAPEGQQYYHGAVSLAQGNAFSYGGTDETNMSTTSYANAGVSKVNTTAGKYGVTYAKPSNTDNNRVPATGLTMDATYQIVNKDTTPAAGTFVFAISGINLDRDPDVGGGNNVAKPLWYSYNENFSGANGKDHSFFSEAMEITGGQASDYVYVRPNTSQEDNPEKVTGVNGQYFYPNVSLHNGNIKFISNALDKALVGYGELKGNDNSYNAGFVTLADAATGFKVTATGHGSAKNFMNSLVFNSKQIWYRYTSSTGRHGSIQTTSEGNYKGTLNDGGDILEPEGYFEDGSATHNKKATYVVSEGKDVYYTMTPDTGYKLKTLKIGKTFDANGVPTEYEEVKFNGESVNTMKKGDQLEVTTKAGKKGLLKYNGDGTYVFKFEYALHNEAIHVEWEPVTADILVSKVWDDEDDKDGMREDAYEKGKYPFFRLEYSINGGRTWNPVNNNTIGGTTAQPSTTISPEQVPSGKDEESGSPTQGKYLDGTYTIDKGTTGTYESSAASPQPTAAQLVEISETCDGLPIFEDQKTFKKYVKIEGSYREVTSVDHPYTWQNLPVYKYDASGDADRMISYRIVEYHVSDADATKFVDNEAIKDYEPAEYYDAQAFELTSETSKSVEGWQIYEDSSSGQTYVKRGDELYYEVDSTGAISDTPADPQPDEDRLVAQTSIEYRTADKGIAYQMADVRNYHEPKYVYVEVGKEWNDDGIKDVTTGDGVNEYARKNLKFVLKGKTTAGQVDINGDAEGQDLATIIKENETADRTAAEADKKIDGYQIFEKENDSNEKYAWVKGHDDYEDGYYKIVNDAIDYADAAAPYSGLTDLVAIGAFKKDEKNFGMRFEDLPTHDGGKPITYTVTEYFEDTSTTPSTWIEAGEKEIAWVTTGGDLQEVRVIDGNTSKVVGYTSDFVNTPTIEDVYETLPLTILKQDVVTEDPLESAEFTIYRKSTGSKAFDKNDLYEVEGQTIYYNQNDTVEYVLRKKDGQPDSDKKLYYHIFAEDPQNPGDYIYTYVTSQPDASELTVKKQMVESNVITTKTNGMNTFNILLPGNYEVRETKAPTGYTADSKSYTFSVDRNLKKITLENDDDDHETKWWKKLYDLLFRDGQPDNADGRWTPATDKKGGTLKVNDQPIDASILVRKYWEDNDDQDGVRPEDGDANMPKVILEWTTAAHTATGLPVYTDAKGKVKYVHNQSDNEYYKVTKEDEYGKYVTSAAQPQPDADKLTEVADTTCQGRKVYKDQDDKRYVYVDEKYHELEKDTDNNYLVDTQGTVESTPAARQPKESELRLVMDEGAGWQTTKLYDETSKAYDKDAEAPVNYADGPVLTHQHDAYTWNDVPAYRNGKPVVYRVAEASPLLDDGTYRLKSSHTSDTKEKVFTLINNSGENVSTHNQTVDVTNRHETRIINIDAYKVWNDDDPTKRKESTLTLWKEVNGARSIVSKTEGGHTTDDTGTVPTTDETDPVKIWSDLPVFERGYPITYTIEETTIDGYKTVYELDYTKENGTSEGEEIHIKSDTVDAEDVKRTYYQGATDKKISGETVYTDGTNEYVKHGDDYYEVTGETIADSPADPQPDENDLEVAKNDDSDIPSGVDKEPGDESTTASFTIENEETIDIPIKKTWIDGANANVTFQLWRTTTKEEDLTSSVLGDVKEYELTSNPDTKISVAQYRVLSDADKALYTPVKRIICYQHNETGNYISVQDYNDLPDSEKSKYTAVEGSEWSPYDPADPSKTVDGWERADDIQHEFLSRDFENEHTPGFSVEETFKNLPRQKIETAEGKTLYKEKTGTNPKKYVLMEDPEATGQDVGKEFYFTFTVDEETGEYTYTKANPQPNRDDLQVSYLAYMYRVFEVPKLVRYTADQTSDFNITNYNLHASNGFANVEVVKELEGRKWDVNGKDEFYFEMEPISAKDITNPSHRISDDDIPLPSRMVNNRPVYKDDNDKRYVIDGDDLYREVDDNDKVADKPANPQPKADNLTQDGTINASINYPIDTSKDKKVGAIGRAVDFKSIEFSDESVVPRGNTVEFNYKVREVYDMLGTSIDDATNHTGKRNGITYAGEVVGSEFVPEEHDLKIVVKNDDSGKMTTEIYWDGATQAGAVPVYTNKYSSESEAKAWIEKEIKTRKWEDYDESEKTGDAFRYEILAISGSQLNVPGADHSEGEDSYESKPLISNADDNPQKDIQKESDYEYAFGLTGNKYTGDMLNSNGEGYFIYAIREMDKVTWEDEEQLFGGLKFENYKVDGLEYDDETIYAKVKVNDNWDGTLKFEVKYYSDAACRKEITNYKVWIADKFTGGDVDPTAADPQPTNLIETTEILNGNVVYYNKANKKRYVKVIENTKEYWHEVVGGTEDKTLLSQDEIEAMAAMTQDQKDANGYRQVSVAHFINRETIDIPVSKEWAGGPAVEDVNLHLKRHLFELKDEEKLDSKTPSTETEPTGDDFVKSAEDSWTGGKPFWQPIGLTHIVKRGAFLDANGEPKYDDDEKTISTQTYGDLKADDGQALEKEDYIKGFNKDLPKYVKVDGKIYRAVYRLEEDDTSDAYKRSYKRVEESETPGGDPVVKKDAQIYINSGTLVVTNKVTATNTANIAAVKQLLGRGWMNTDDFEFEIEALGKGKYNKDTGKFVEVDTSADAKKAVPMPGHYKNKNDDDDVISIEAYNALTDEEKANYEYVGNNKEAHAKKTGTTVDPNGDLERLARFDSIEYKVTDLTYDPSDKHMQGDFYYVIREKIPDDATIEVTDGGITRTVTYAEATAAQKAAGGFKKNGITYDGTEHMVHVKVRENRTGKLQTQIAYDEKPKYDAEGYKADITTGTQFTPVFTNKYTSEVDVEVKGNKYIMGRDWAEGDNFDFVMIPMAGAPFKDANRSDFPAQDTNTDEEREAALEDKTDGIAIHNKDGEHVMRLFVDKTKDVQEFSFPKIKVKSEDLHKVTDAESQAEPEEGKTDKRIRDKDGNVLPTGVTYGQFMYAIAETDEFDKLNAGSVEDLIKDPDTEYARVTVYDPGNGVLEYRVDIFEDRYGNIPRYKPNPETGEETKIPADAVTFVNKLDRDLTAIKAWDGTSTEDVTLKLQWSVLGDSSWHDVESTEWFPNIDGTKIIRKNATGDELKATWPKLPTYANISEYDDMSGESGDNIELNDMWIYYRVVEDPEPAQAAVYYNEVAYEEGDNPKTTIIVEGVEKDKYSEEPYHTGPEKDEHDEYLKPEKRVHTLHVTNFPTNNNVKASFGVVKQFIGRAWDKEEFQFTAEPVKSRLGGATEYINNGTYYKKGPKPDEMDQETYDAAADILYKEAYEELSDGPVKELYSEKQNSMPKEFVGNDNTATAKKSDDKKLKVSVNEYAANFKDLTIYRSDLAFNPDTKKMEGEFVYKIKEVIPANAEKTDDYVEDAGGNKFYYYVVNDGKGNNIKYTSEEHFVTIKAVDEGSGNITTTVTYDGRKSGEYVPVYTNYALMPTPITGTKTWVGGKESEHVNGKVTLNADNTQIVKTEATAEKEGTPKDDLGLKLTRKLPGEQDYNVVTQDDAKRPLVIIWAKEKRTTHPRDFYFKSGDPAVVAGKTYYSYDVDTDTYTAVTNTEGKSPSDEGWFEKTVVTDYDFEYEKQETGNGTYTIKAVVTKDGETTYVDPLLKTVDDDGNEYDYKISETKVPDDKYKESINGLDVTNTHKVEDNLKVTKTWDDAQDAEGLRPEEVIVHLYKEVIVPATTEGGEATTKTVQVEVDKKSIKYDEAKDPDEHTWSTGVVFDNLPLYDSNGNVIKYYVLEEGVAGYTATYAANSTAAGDYKDEENLVKIELDGQKDRTDPESETDNPQFIDIKNSLTPATDTVEVTKVWKDNDNNDGKRPKTVTFKLYKYVWNEETGKYPDAPVLVDKRPATAADIALDVAEKGDSSNMRLGDDITVSAMTLNGEKDETTTVYLNKETGKPISAADYEDLDADGKAEYEVKTVPKSMIFFEDTPASQSSWNGKWLNLPLTENGKTIIYTVKEDPETVTGYQKSVVTGDQLGGFKVTNTHEPLKGEVLVDKVWDDAGNEAGKRTGTAPVVKLQSTTKDPSAQDFDPDNDWSDVTAATAKSVPMDHSGKITDTAADKTYTWNDLPAFKDGKALTYRVVETGKLAGYDDPTYSVETFKLCNSAGTESRNQEVTVTNTYSKTDVEVTKKWVDSYGNAAAPATGVRPTADAYESKVELTADNTPVIDDKGTADESDDTPLAPVVTDNRNGTFTLKWTDLPKYKTTILGRSEIEYSVTETQIPGYSEPVYSDADKALNGGTITNTQLVKVDVVKTWNDNNNHDGHRPESIKVTLYRNGQPLGNAEVLKGDDATKSKTTYDDDTWTWTSVWPNLLYADANGTVYNYTAAESEITKWYQAFAGGTFRQILDSTWNTAGDTMIFSITNEDKEEVVEFTVDKIWNDGSDVDDLRPSKIYYRLYQTIDGTKTLVGALPKDAEVSGGTFKTENNGYIEVDANKDDETQGTLKRITITGLPRYAAGAKKITYTIEEDADVSTAATTGTEPMFGYTTEVDGGMTEGFTVTNSHTPAEAKATAVAIKAISGRSFRSGDEFTFTITPKDGAPRPARDYVTITPASGTTANINLLEFFTFTGADMLDKLKAGDTKTFEYEIAEVRGGIEDLSYDTSKKTLKITVTRKADGGLEIKTDDPATTDVDESGVKWGTNNTDAERTFTNIYGGKVELTIRKVWVDKDADSTVIDVRPDSVKVKVTAVTKAETTALVNTYGFTKVRDTEYTKDLTLTKDDHVWLDNSIWQIKTGELPKLDSADNSIIYTVSEDQVPNYQKPQIKPDGDRWIVTNTYESGDFSATKVWDDGGMKHDNAKELKDKLTLQRTTDTDIATATWTPVTDEYHLHWNDDGSSADNKYSQSFKITGLPKKAADGKTYTYRVVESSVGDDYTTTYTNVGDFEDEEGAVYEGGRITNTNQSKVTIMAKKVWKGDADDDKSGRKEIKFQLMRTVDEATKKDGAPKSATASTETYEPIDGWVVWEDLPTIVEGKIATYDVEEVEVPDGYTSKTEYGYDDGGEKWAASKKDIPAGKTWNNKIRITNTLETDTIDVPVMKKWKDNDNQEGYRPKAVKVRIYIDANSNGKYDNGEQVKVKNGKLDDTGTDVADLELKDSNNWKRLFKDLPKTDTNGKAVTYKVAEMDDGTAKEDGDTAFDGKYNVSIEGDMADGYIITNSNDPDTVSVTVTKQWYGDAGVKEDTRKDVKVFLIGYISDDHKDQPAYIGVYQTIKVNKNAAAGEDAGFVTWDKLPKYIGGQELIWTAIEDSVPGYTTTYGDAEIDENNVVNITVKNDYYGPVSKVTATKIWQDGNNRDGKRDDVWFQLYRKIGDGEEEKVDDPIKVDVNRTAADGTDAGKVTWDNLPEIIAETEEVTEDVYKPVDPAPEVGAEITEEWYELDGSGSYEQTKDKTVQAGKTYYIKTTETKEKEKPERAVIYWVKEVNKDGDEAAPDGYTSTVVQTEPGVFEVQNIHVPEKKDIVVKKIWNDDEDKDKIRPDHVTFKLKDGSTVVAKAILTEDDNWAHTFEGMPVKKNGEKINYTVEEDSVAGYTASGPAEGQDGSSEKPFTIINTRNRKLVDVKVKKVWAGDEGHEAETRGDVKVNLVEIIEEEDGEARKVIDTQTLTFDASDPDKEMSYEWKSKPTHRSGKDIKYEVTENDVDDYTMTGNEMEVDAQGNYSITITNTYGHIASHDVIYVDPKNNDGEMILKSDKYSPKEAQKQAQGKLNPPAEPSHSGTKFIGWAVNFDREDNWVLVAKYQDNPVKPVPTISYIDPQSGKVIVSKQTDDPSSVKPPANPKAKNMQFTGWVMTTDAAGNTIWLAKYECDCSNGGGKDVDKSNVQTGDDAMLTVWMLLFVMAVSFMVLTMMLRNRGINAVRDTYKPKH